MAKVKESTSATSNFSTQDSEAPKKPFTKKDIFISRVKRRFLRNIWVARLTLFSLVILAVYLVLVLLGIVFNQIGISKYMTVAYDFVFTPEKKIATTSGRTDILIMGKAGEGHTAPDLTDTIIFASVSHADSSVILLSLPRDIWIPSLRAKLNSAYYWGNQKQPPAQGASRRVGDSQESETGPEGKGGGLILAKSSTEEIVGKPIHYGIVVDFSGFKRIIDVLGGIEVDVSTSFVDEKYPIAGRENDECEGDPEFKCRYETVKFDAGIQTMDGETALIFVRSRNAEGDEGTDLARSARQQKVISALKKRVLKPDILLSPKKILTLWEVTKDSVETDMDPSAVAIMFRRAVENGQKISSFVLPEEFLLKPPASSLYDNLYVFLPRGEAWESVHGWVDCVFREGSCEPEKFVNL